MEITCYRDREVASEPYSLPAATYNLAHTLLARSPNGCLFVRNNAGALACYQLIEP